MTMEAKNTGELIAGLRFLLEGLEAAGERDLPGHVYIDLGISLHYSDCTNADLRAAVDYLAAACGFPEAAPAGKHYETRTVLLPNAPIRGQICAFLKGKSQPVDVELEP